MIVVSNTSPINYLALFAAATAFAMSSVEQDAAWVNRRIQQWQPTAHERQWEQTGWANGLSEALRLAKQHRRPVFLFTHDGRLNVARC